MLVIYFSIPIFAALIVAIVKIHLETNREIKEFKKWTEQN